MDNKTANKILIETETGYDLIAQKFSQTRKHFWRGLEFIKDYTHENDNVLDFGCGNGRLLGLLESKDINYWGVDVSEKLIECAKSQHPHNCHSQLDWGSSLTHQSGEDLDSLPTGQAGRFHGNDKRVCFQKIDPRQESLAFEEGFFNTIYSIAVFHHFPSKKYRQHVANELYRITADGGYVVVTAWHLWQGKYRKNIFKNWKEKIFETVIRMSGIRSAGLRRDSGVNNLDWNDCQISFTDNSGKKFERFHHAFTRRELQKLFESAGFETEKCEVADGRNILYIGKKG